MIVWAFLKFSTICTIGFCLASAECYKKKSINKYVKKKNRFFPHISGFKYVAVEKLINKMKENNVSNCVEKITYSLQWLLLIIYATSPSRNVYIKWDQLHPSLACLVVLFVKMKSWIVTWCSFRFFLLAGINAYVACRPETCAILKYTSDWHCAKCFISRPRVDNNDVFLTHCIWSSPSVITEQ